MSTAVSAELYAESTKRLWEALQNVKTGFTVSKADLITASKFLLTALDEAVKYAQENMTVGAEKKVFVLTVIGRLYDSTIGPLLPYWLYPFSSYLKNFVVNILLSQLIDYVVGKYKSGDWGNFVQPTPIIPVPDSAK